MDALVSEAVFQMAFSYLWDTRQSLQPFICLFELGDYTDPGSITELHSLALIILFLTMSH